MSDGDPELPDDATIAALGALSEALETVEHARGLLYGFHRLTGSADLKLSDAVEKLRRAGATELAERIDRELVGRNVISERWTFQIVDEYDADYYATFRELEEEARNQLAGGVKHLAEARMKEQRRTHGLPHHERGESPIGLDD
jgi:hypothetical protein